MRKILLLTLLLALVAASPAWAGQAILSAVPAPSFEKALRALEQNNSSLATKLLQQRVDFLKKARANKWTVSDGEPPLVQSMLINYRLKLIEGDIDGALDDFDFMVYELKFADAKHFAFTLTRQMKQVTEDSDAFRESTKRVARATWFFRSMQQPKISSSEKVEK